MRILKEIKSLIRYKYIKRNLQSFGKERFRKSIYKLFNDSDQIFGRGELYQSLPELDINGQRPSDYRIEKYGLNDILRKEYNVLDIGCNVGFLDIMIADKVNHVTGIEYNKDLCRIAVLVCDYLSKEKKCDFINCDFNDWIKKNEQKYDIVFSFAIHYWLRTNPTAYATILSSILKSGGYLVFESQNLDTVDKEFEEYINEFIQRGFLVVDNGLIKDDNIIERKYYVFKRK